MTKTMQIKVVVMLSYSGFSSGSSRERIFWKIIEKATDVDSRPIVVVNRDTKNLGRTDAFYADSRSKDVEIILVWSVDTCQMWLSGWGHAIDNYPDCDRVVLLPGDIDAICEEDRFFRNLNGLLEAGHSDIVIGDFTSKNIFSSKELIDTYGTYQLLANWFEDLSRAIKELPLLKPRSEFISIKTSVLRDLLRKRKFAYEQTLNILIQAWDFDKSSWRSSVSVQELGELQDDRSLRQYRDTLDQIERTERLLRLLWREINEPKETGNRIRDEKEYRKYIDRYSTLDHRSSAIRDSATNTIRTLMGA